MSAHYNNLRRKVEAAVAGYVRSLDMPDPPPGIYTSMQATAAGEHVADDRITITGRSSRPGIENVDATFGATPQYIGIELAVVTVPEGVEFGGVLLESAAERHDGLVGALQDGLRIDDLVAQLEAQNVERLGITQVDLPREEFMTDAGDFRTTLYFDVLAYSKE